jgi:hypothetical protein
MLGGRKDVAVPEVIFMNVFNMGGVTMDTANSQQDTRNNAQLLTRSGLKSKANSSPTNNTGVSHPFPAFPV